MPKLQQQRTKAKFKQYNIGSVHIDVSEVGCAEGKYWFVAIEPTCKFAYSEHPQVAQPMAAAFLEHLIAAVADKIRITD